MKTFGIREGIPLAPLTTWHIGGPAQYFFEPQNTAQLQAFIKAYPEEPKVFLGLGSNVLIPDEGLRGVVISLRPAFQACHRVEEGVFVEAGTPCAKIAKLYARERLKGGAFWAGIPGTLGGALAMNAGAFGGETWSLVNEVLILTPKGELERRPAADFKIAYRSVQGPLGLAFIAAYLRATACDHDQPEENIKALLAQRQATQPIGSWNCGSVFRNPPGDYAARLIEACGLKGFSFGGAQVSIKHANFIINTGGARAVEVKQLIAHIQQCVINQFGITLEPEVRLL